jgi:hypothetical protein
LEGGKQFSEFVWNSDEVLRKGEYHTYESFMEKYLPHSTELVTMPSLTFVPFTLPQEETEALTEIEKQARMFNYANVDGFVDYRRDEICIKIIKPYVVRLDYQFLDIYDGNFLSDLLCQRLLRVKHKRLGTVDGRGMHNGTFQQRAQLLTFVGHDLVYFLCTLVKNFPDDKRLLLYAVWYCNTGCTLPSSRDEYERLVTRIVCEHLTKDKNITGRMTCSLIEYQASPN